MGLSVPSSQNVRMCVEVGGQYPSRLPQKKPSTRLRVLVLTREGPVTEALAGHSKLTQLHDEQKVKTGPLG
jgi:hypothetical protein